MRVADLPLAVKAAKSNWVPADRSLDFTPTDGTLNARETCRSAVARQAHESYVVEYISRTIEKPNPGYEQSPEYLQEMERRAGLGGKLIRSYQGRMCLACAGPPSTGHLGPAWVVRISLRTVNEGAWTLTALAAGYTLCKRRLRDRLI